MGVVTVALEALLPKLEEVLTGEYQLQTCVRDDVTHLKLELENMKAAFLKLSEASLDEPPDIQDKLWETEFREISYDIEDRLDSFMARVNTLSPNDELHGLRALIDRGLCLFKRAKIFRNFGMDVKGIKRRIEEASDRRVKYKVDTAGKRHTGPTTSSLRLSALYQMVTDLVGIEDRKNELVRMLKGGDDLSQQQQLKIVSIVGFGGLGKTTLAKRVYDNPEEDFECRAFVSVSLNPNMISIFHSILHQLVGIHMGQAIRDESHLIEEIREFLRDKKYFIVIDDIWDNSVWENIQYALIKNERGSRIITTTRIFDVGKQAGDVYQLEPLSPVDSRKLFCLRIYGSEERYLPDELADLSNRILSKCSGVPLAIITIASTLASSKKGTEDIKYWHKVYQSMGSGLLEASNNVKNMRKILSVSYYDLPVYLKACLLYLSKYLEDHVINTGDLISKWVGEGFVIKEQGKTFYETGENYVCELINRGLIEPADIDEGWYGTSRITSCRIHDMVLDLITFLSNKDGFLTILDGHKGPTNLPTKIRRLSLKNCNEDNFKELSRMSLSHVRSLFVFDGAFSTPLTLSSFPVLRVLDLTGWKEVEDHHFKAICNMLLLRCLKLRCSDFTEIPQEIGNLKFLQALDLGLKTVNSLPSSFCQLGQLVYFKFGDINCCLPEGFGNLRSLQRLVGYIWPSSLNDMLVLCGMTELRHVKLDISRWDESYEQPFLRFLSNMVNLEYLRLNGTVYMDIGSSCEHLSPGPQQLRIINLNTTIQKVPRWMSSLSALSMLRLMVRELTEEDIRVLGSIPSLSRLWIDSSSFSLDRGTKLVISNASPFLSLTDLKLSHRQEIVFTPGAMQNLRTLMFIIDVREMMQKFGDIDFGLENLSSLEDVSIYVTSYVEPEELEAAKAAMAAIQNAVNMNPNKPRLKLMRL